MFGLLGLGTVGIIILLVIALLLPLILTAIIGVGIANMIGLTGIYWWAFVILFYIVVGAILGALGI